MTEGRKKEEKWKREKKKEKRKVGREREKEKFRGFWVYRVLKPEFIVFSIFLERNCVFERFKTKF